MKTIQTLTIISLFALAVAGAGVSCSKAPATQTQSTKQYTCPMHPEVVQGEPGKCPKCGMALKLK